MCSTVLQPSRPCPGSRERVSHSHPSYIDVRPKHQAQIVDKPSIVLQRAYELPVLEVPATPVVESSLRILLLQHLLFFSKQFSCGAGNVNISMVCRSRIKPCICLCRSTLEPQPVPPQVSLQCIWALEVLSQSQRCHSGAMIGFGQLQQHLTVN